MQSRWNDADFSQVVENYVAAGWNRDLAVRTYTTRLLGSDPSLVLHGGGNTSVKTKMVDVTGQSVPVLCVKGSGWDMGTIEPPGLPAVRLEPLCEMAALESLSDDEMVARQRELLLDPAAPNPSVEAILHAILPSRHVDHTHANAVVALTNQPGGEALVRELYPRSIVVPYVMPGFELAKACKAAFEADPGADGMILLKHGIFTWSDDPREAYERMIEAVDRAERRLAGCARPVRAVTATPEKETLLSAREVGPILRGALARGEGDGTRRFVLEHRASDTARAFCARPNLPDLVRRGNATPEHVLHIKRYGLALPRPVADQREAWIEDVHAAVARYEDEYRAYFERNNRRVGGGKRMLDPSPRAFYVPGVGIFAAGSTRKSALVCADVMEATIEVVSKAEAVSSFEALEEEDLFDIEYWSLEQAKLAKQPVRPLTGRVAVVAGDTEDFAGLLRSDGMEIVRVSDDAQEGVKDTVEPLTRLGGFDLLVVMGGSSSYSFLAAAREVVALQSFGAILEEGESPRSELPEFVRRIAAE